jgi:protein-L-isoaspartate O-methyltransferase
MSQQAAREWDARYVASDSLFGEESNSFLVRQRGLFRPGQRALVVADGSGRHGAWLASLGLQVDAFDIAPEGDRQARLLDARRGVQVNRQVCGWEDWPRWEGYDHVVAIFVQFSAPDERTRMFERMATSLLPGGHLHLLGYSKKQLIYGTGGPKDTGRLYDAALLNQAFPMLRMLELSQYEAVLEEGSAHRGPSALIGYVGRRDA